METIPEDQKCVIKTQNGPICGFIEKTDKKTYYKFKSIPYAKPPIGSLRFLPPCLVNSWTDVKDCTKDAPLPLSFSMKNELVGSEDCLYIEVSTPSVQPEKPLPVMFWIGCLCFEWTIDSIYDPALLNDEGVVFIRCGFRLGPFGFLSIHDFTAPGNCGLKDLAMALKWVNTNISAFGGDPNNVTLFGNSAGGAIIHFMMLSPMATGLFHKAIIQSASTLNNWSWAKNPSQSVAELGKLLGIDKSYKVEIVEELKAASAKDIMEAFLVMMQRAEQVEMNDVIDSLFKPCIEIEFEGQPAFLSKSPATLLKTGNFNKVPLIIGSTNIEGELLQFIRDDFYNDFEKYNQNVSLLVPKSLSRDLQVRKKIGQQLLKFYLGAEEQLTEDTKTQYLQLISDYYFLYYVNKTVRLHNKFAPECPIYYYIINYAGEWRVPKDYRIFNSMGHCAELPFIFRLKMPDSPTAVKGSRDSEKTRSRVVRMWSNFAKHGNPTPDETDPLLQIKWDPVEHKNKLNYLSIGSELTKGSNPFQERMAFWDELHRQYTFLRALVYFNDLGVSW